MALNEIRHWMVAYDIADPRRLGRVHRYLKTVAVPVQYSVFVAEESAAGVRRIRDRLAALINPREDDVRIYLVPKRADATVFGRATLPSGLLLLTRSPLLPLGERNVR